MTISLSSWEIFANTLLFDIGISMVEFIIAIAILSAGGQSAESIFKTSSLFIMPCTLLSGKYGTTDLFVDAISEEKMST